MILRPPAASDATRIFERYASDPDVCRYLAFPIHRSIDDTRSFIAFSDAEWEKAPAGPYLLIDAASGELIGSTGLSFETPETASTGYVIAKDCWGRGYASEALRAMVSLAGSLGVTALHAFVHVEHAASENVLRKAGFVDAGVRQQFFEFPNLAPGIRQDVRCFVCDRFAQSG